MKDEKKRRQEKIFLMHPKLGEGFHWLDQNRKMFRRPVWGPIAREVSPKSANASAYLESHVSINVLKSYVVECKEDYNLLYSELREKRNLPANIILIPNGKLQCIQRIHGDQKFATFQREHGVLEYLDESFEAPDAVRQALVESASVHSVLVGTEKTHNIVR